ncbi:hypothetical protein ACFW04_014667 [Cataglyphis niger]
MSDRMRVYKCLCNKEKESEKKSVCVRAATYYSNIEGDIFCDPAQGQGYMVGVTKHPNPVPIIFADCQPNVSHTCIEKKLKTLGYVKKLDLWIPHQLKEIHLTQRISICDSLLKRNENDPFLKNLVTGDEKWIVYNNVTRKRSWVKQDQPAQTASKAEIHQKKIMLSVWWDYKGILYFELMPQNQTINSNVYVEQLDKLKDAIEEKRPVLSKL